MTLHPCTCPDHAIPAGPSSSLLPHTGPPPTLPQAPNQRRPRWQHLPAVSLPDSQAQEMLVHTLSPILWAIHTAPQYWDPHLLQPHGGGARPETDACLMLSTGHLRSWASVSRFSSLGHSSLQTQSVMSGKSHAARLGWALNSGVTTWGGGLGFPGHTSPCWAHL